MQNRSVTRGGGGGVWQQRGGSSGGGGGGGGGFVQNRNMNRGGWQQRGGGGGQRRDGEKLKFDSEYDFEKANEQFEETLKILKDEGGVTKDKVSEGKNKN